MFSFLAALTIYLALSPIHPSVALAQMAPQPTAQLRPAPMRAVPLPQAPVKKDESRLGIVTTADSAILVDWGTLEALYEKNADKPRPIASITKLMTALVMLSHNPDWDQIVTMTGADMRSGDVTYLAVGEQVTVRDLFNMSLIASSNDATAALARSTGITEEQFVTEMNSLAKDVGLTEAKFTEPTGLDAGNVASARDVARLIRRSLESEDVRVTVASRDYTLMTVGGASKRIRSTDNLLGSFLNKPPFRFLGGKTGYIGEAGYCFGAAAENADGNRLIGVVLGASTKQDRFSEVKSLIYWGFDVFAWPQARS